MGRSSKSFPERGFDRLSRPSHPRRRRWFGGNGRSEGKEESSHGRMVLRLPGALMLLDIAKDGRILLMRASWRRELIGVTDSDSREHELSWLDYSYPADLSADGKTLLFDEEGGGGALSY